MGATMKREIRFLFDEPSSCRLKKHSNKPGFQILAISVLGAFIATSLNESVRSANAED